MSWSAFLLAHERPESRQQRGQGAGEVHVGRDQAVGFLDCDVAPDVVLTGEEEPAQCRARRCLD
ncbi:hypothetical protein ACWEKM_00255 [Streptomyces sp. NPDC004752]